MKAGGKGFVPAIVIATLLLPPASCLSQSDSRGFSIGPMDDAGSFAKLTENELELDSMRRMSPEEGLFRDNRSRVRMSYSTNGVAHEPGDLPAEGYPMPCHCAVRNDTLIVAMGVGFFGGVGFEILFTPRDVTSTFFEYTDDVEPYKAQLNDSAWSSIVRVVNHLEHVRVNEAPPTAAGRIFSGSLDYRTEPYYERPFGDQVDTVQVSGTIRFTCVSRQAGPED